MSTSTDQIRKGIVVILFSGLLATPVFARKGGGSADAHTAKGFELVQQKQYDAAVAEFTKAIQADPKDAKNYSNRGTALRALGKLPEALADCSKAIEIAPKDYFGYMERSQTELTMNDF